MSNEAGRTTTTKRSHVDWEEERKHVVNEPDGLALYSTLQSEESQKDAFHRMDELSLCAGTENDEHLWLFLTVCGH